MLNPLFVKWLNAELVKDLEDTVDRIPRDLKTWRSIIKRLSLKSIRTRKQNKQIIEYGALYNYYLGKMCAYTYVLGQLGDSKFVTQWEKKFNVKYIPYRGERYIDGSW